MDKHYEFRKGKSHCAVIEFEPASTVPQPRPNYLFNLIYKESECDDVICIYLDLPNSNTRFVKCCHGMLCLILCRGDLVRSDIGHIISPDIIFDVLVLNPFTGEVKVLPFIKVPDKPPNRQRLEIQFGFGLSNNMTWKVIMLLSFEDANRKIDSHEIVMVCSQSIKGHLVWFDIDDEVFGKIERPSNVKGLDFYTVMSECIVVVTVQLPCTENEVIWKEGDEVFGMIEPPSNVKGLDYYTVMNESHRERRYTNSNYYYPGYHDVELYFKDGFVPN
nr:putative F-box protein At1g19160 [Ipomoea batatas]